MFILIEQKRRAKDECQWRQQKSDRKNEVHWQEHSGAVRLADRHWRRIRPAFGQEFPFVWPQDTCRRPGRDRHCKMCSIHSIYIRTLKNVGLSVYSKL